MFWFGYVDVGVRWRVGMPGFVRGGGMGWWGGVGWGGVGWGGGGGWAGMITFLFINVPACAFLTRGSFVCALLE